MSDEKDVKIDGKEKYGDWRDYTMGQVGYQWGPPENIREMIRNPEKMRISNLKSSNTAFDIDHKPTWTIYKPLYDLLIQDAANALYFDYRFVEIDRVDFHWILPHLGISGNTNGQEIYDAMMNDELENLISPEYVTTGNPLPVVVHLQTVPDEQQSEYRTYYKGKLNGPSGIASRKSYLTEFRNYGDNDVGPDTYGEYAYIDRGMNILFYENGKKYGPSIYLEPIGPQLNEDYLQKIISYYFDDKDVTEEEYRRQMNKLISEPTNILPDLSNIVVKYMK